MNIVEPSPQAPEDFTAFVAAYSSEVRSAIQSITANDRLIESMQRDAFASVALRWWWLSRRGDAEAAAKRLRNVLRREVSSWPGELDRKGLTVVPPGGRVPPETADLAARAWRQGVRLRGRRRLLVIGVVAAVAVLLIAAPRHPARPDSETPPVDDSPLPVALPPNVQVVPSIVNLSNLPAQATTAVPHEFRLASAVAQPVGGGKPGQARLLLQAGTGELVAVAADASTWRIDADKLNGARLQTTSLSPDGKRAALNASGGLLLADLSTGALKPISVPFVSTVPTVVWVSLKEVVVQGTNGAFVVDVESGRFTAITEMSGADVVGMTRNAQDRIVELLPADAAQGVASRIRYWPTTAPDVDQAEELPIAAPPWMARWTGPGLGNKTWLLRGCDAAAMRLPEDVGVAREAVCAVDRRGLAGQTLVTAQRTSTLEAEGWLNDKTAVVRFSASPGGRSWLLAWDVTTGTLSQIAPVDGYVRATLPDLTSTVDR